VYEAVANVETLHDLLVPREPPVGSTEGTCFARWTPTGHARQAFLANLDLPTFNRDPFAEFSEQSASFGDNLPAQLWTELDTLKRRPLVR
jgi:hypothetical protein